MFRRAYRLPFDPAGIPVFVDVSFLVVLPLMVLGAMQYLSAIVRHPMLGLDPSRFTGLTPVVLGLVSALLLFACVVLHELGHSLTARRYGVRVRRITLWFLGGVAELEEMPRQRGAEAVVGVAGPVVSFVLAGVFYALTRVVPPSAQSAWLVCFYLTGINLMLGLFNLLPALPMDGGRILRSLLALRMPHARATVVAGNVSKVLAIGLGLWCVPHLNVWPVILAFFIFNAVRAETRQDVARDLLAGLGVADLMNRDVRTVPASATVGALSWYVVTHHHRQFPVVDDRGRCGCG